MISILKYAGLTVLCLSLSSVGFYITHFHRKRCELLGILSELFSEMSAALMLSGGDMISLMKRLPQADRFGCLSFISAVVSRYEDGCDLRLLWESCIRESDELRYLDRYSREQLIYFSGVLGKSGMEEFSQRCRKYSESFLLSAQREEKERQKNASLYMGISAFGAAAVFIIFA